MTTTQTTAVRLAVQLERTGWELEALGLTTRSARCGRVAETLRSSADDAVAAALSRQWVR